MTRYDPSNDERLADWVDGRLGEVERARLEAEFRVHPELQQAAERYRRGVETMRSALAEERTPPGLSARIQAHVAAESGLPPRRWVPVLGSFAAAAALVLAFFWVRAGLQEQARFEDVALRPAAEALDDAAASKAVGDGGAARLRRGAGERQDGAAVLRVAEDAEGVASSSEPPTAPAPESRRAEQAMPVDERGRVVLDRDEARSEASPGAEPQTTDAVESGAATDWSAGGPEDVIVVVELPAAETGDAAAGRAIDGAENFYAGVPAREQAEGGDLSIPVPVQQLSAGALAGDQVIQLLSQTVTSEQLWQSNATAPQVFALPQLAATAETDSEQQREEAEQIESQRGLLDRSHAAAGKVRPAPSAAQLRFVPRAEDQTFQVVGDAEQLTLLVRELSRQTRALGGQVHIERMAAPMLRERLFVPGGQPTGQAGFVVPEISAPITWIVVRRIPEPITPPPEPAATDPNDRR